MLRTVSCCFVGRRRSCSAVGRCSAAPPLGCSSRCVRFWLMFSSVSAAAQNKHTSFLLLLLEEEKSLFSETLLKVLKVPLVLLGGGHILCGSASVGVCDFQELDERAIVPDVNRSPEEEKLCSRLSEQCFSRI